MLSTALSPLPSTINQMAYSNNTNFFPATPTDVNFNFYPDWSTMLPADAANIQIFNALADNE